MPRDEREHSPRAASTQPAERRRHDSKAKHLRELCRLGKLLKLFLKTDAKTEAQQHLAAKQQHSRFTEHIINRVI